MLLPDQTYEQCQDMLAPVVALKRILDDTESKPQIEIEYNEKSIVTNDDNDDNNTKKKKNEHENGGDWSDVDDEDDDDHGNKNELEMLIVNGDENEHQDEKRDRFDTPESYDQTSDFFNNVPDFHGEPLGPFSIPHVKNSQQTSADLMRECELFLYRHRIRPDFFCRYRKVVEYDF